MLYYKHFSTRLVLLFSGIPALSVDKRTFKESFLTKCGTTAEAKKQGVFSSQAYQFLTRLYKEYDLVKIPGSLLVRLQFDLVMREWIVIQEIQQFPLQILLT